MDFTAVDAIDVDTVYQFRQRLDFELKKISRMCDSWENMMQQMGLSQHVQQSILNASGRARLMISNQMKHFAALVARCERPDRAWPHALAVPGDLRHFSDTVFNQFMQVDKLDSRLKKLEQLRARNIKKKIAVRVSASSRLEDMLNILRRGQQQVPSGGDGQRLPEAAGTSQNVEPRQPRRSNPGASGNAGQQTPPANQPFYNRRKQSLLKTILIREAKKAAAQEKAEGNDDARGNQ